MTIETPNINPNCFYNLPIEVQDAALEAVEATPGFADMNKKTRNKMLHMARMQAVADDMGVPLKNLEEYVKTRKAKEREAEAIAFAAKEKENVKKRLLDMHEISNEWKHVGEDAAEKIAPIVYYYSNEINLLDSSIAYEGLLPMHAIEVKVRYDLFHNEVRLGCTTDDELAQKQKEMWAHDFGIWMSKDNPEEHELLEAQKCLNAIYCAIADIGIDEIHHMAEGNISDDLFDNSRIVDTHWYRNEHTGHFDITTTFESTFIIRLGA